MSREGRKRESKGVRPMEKGATGGIRESREVRVEHASPEKSDWGRQVQSPEALVFMEVHRGQYG